MTLGPTLLFLGNSEKIKGRIADFFITFGRVPFFFYIIHIYVIHFFATVLAQLTVFGWKAMVLDGFISNSKDLVGYGVNLWFVYLIWLSIILLLYPLSRRFSAYKLGNKNK